MAATPKLFYRGAAATSSATLYTVPSTTTSVLTDIVISNTNLTITKNGQELLRTKLTFLEEDKTKSYKWENAVHETPVFVSTEEYPEEVSVDTSVKITKSIHKSISKELFYLDILLLKNVSFPLVYYTLVARSLYEILIPILDESFY